MKTMKRTYSSLALCGALIGAAPFIVAKESGQAAAGIPPSIITPDQIETRIGTLEFQDGAPTVETAEKVRDALDFTRGLNAYNNSFRGASAYAIRQGFLSIGAEDNSVVIFSDLMDAKSLFLTANADTVYYLGVIDLSKGPMVIEQPPRGWAPSTTCGSAGLSTLGFPDRIEERAANTSLFRQTMTVPCLKAASLLRTRRRIVCFMPPAHFWWITIRSQPSS
jgi:Protein of unknown function (DUF1254)